MRSFSVIFLVTTQSKISHPLGENSPNLVTLLTSDCDRQALCSGVSHLLSLALTRAPPAVMSSSGNTSYTFTASNTFNKYTIAMIE
jgi:predicted sugar kinase